MVLSFGNFQASISGLYARSPSVPPCPCPQNSALARGRLVEKGHTKRLLVRFTVLRVGRMTGLLIIARVNIPLAIMIVRSRPYGILCIHPNMMPFFESPYYMRGHDSPASFFLAETRPFGFCDITSLDRIASA